MSYDDFCRLTFDEFAAVYEAYIVQRESFYKDDWERMRLLACITIQPHINHKKGKVTPQRLLPFPWDKEQQRPKNKGPKLTPEQTRRRFEQLVKKLGDKL